MTLATRLALLEAQTKASRTAEDAIRRARFKEAKGQRPGETPSTLYHVGVSMLGNGPDHGASGYGSPSNPIYRAYRELKILHD